MAEILPEIVEELSVAPVTDMGIAAKIREVVAMEQFGTARSLQDRELRWTVIFDTQARTMPPTVGHGVIYVLPTYRKAEEVFSTVISPNKGRISSVGMAGELTTELRAAIEAEGVSRICAAGEMQAPPLVWKNGGVDLEAWIAGLSRH